jgi:hypothetical protein
MKHQVHVATESGIVSTEAVMQIRRLIKDLARTVDALVAAKNRPRADADDLDTRRRNLMITIASLEDRLDCIEKVRSREYGAHANLTVPRAHVARLHRVGFTASATSWKVRSSRTGDDRNKLASPHGCSA